MAGETRAETLTLQVFAGTDTTAPSIYSIVGGSTAVTADTGILNGNLAAAGFSAYSFSNLGGSSNNPGSTLAGPLGGAYILTSGNLIVTPGGTGESTPITVTLTEGGFVLPTSSPSLVDTGQANIAGATGSLNSEGVLTDATGASTTVTIPTLITTGTQTAAVSPGTYVTPFTLDPDDPGLGFRLESPRFERVLPEGAVDCGVVGPRAGEPGDDVNRHAPAPGGDGPAPPPPCGGLSEVVLSRPVSDPHGAGRPARGGPAVGIIDSFRGDEAGTVTSR